MKIHKKVKELFPNGVKKADDLVKIFLLYDKERFDFEITDRLVKKKKIIKLRLSSASTPLTFTFDEPHTIEIQLSSSAIPNFTTVDGVDARDPTTALLLFFEHALIHVIMILWDQTDSVSHTPLYTCVLKKIFKHHKIDNLEALPVKITFTPPSPSPSTTPRFGFAYNSNSCYLDSLMTVIFNATKSISTILQETDVEETNYTLFPCGNIDTVDKIKTHAALLQASIVADYNRLKQKDSRVTCSTTRTLLSRCLPGMQVRGRWQTYNVGETYDILTDFFPQLKFDVTTITTIGGIDDPSSKHKASMFTIAEFLVGPDTQQPIYNRILWDKLQAPTLVFYNGGTPRIRNLNEEGEEDTSLEVAGDVYESSVVKTNSFKHTILNDRYSLVGVIFLHGVTERGEGAHYTSIFYSYTDKTWYNYNDLHNRLNKRKPPTEDEVFVDKDGTMPAMYFYQRND